MAYWLEDLSTQPRNLSSDVLQHIKSSDSYPRISMTRGSRRISDRSSREDSVMMVYQKPHQTRHIAINTC